MHAGQAGYSFVNLRAPLPFSSCFTHAAPPLPLSTRPYPVDDVGDAMIVSNRVSTGIPGLDEVIDQFRIGDNVVWQVGSVSEYRSVVKPFARRTREDGRRLAYCRFGIHPPLLSESEAGVIYRLEPDKGFETFTTRVHQIIHEEGKDVFYVFDCLSDLLEYWYSDLMIGNFFQVACPALFKLDTVACFALMRGTHINTTIARIRTTTQILLDLHTIAGKTYVHPLKVWERYSPTMFFPHLIEGDRATSITASSEAAALFSGQWQLQQARDYWEITLEQAKSALVGGAREQERSKELLLHLLLGDEPGIGDLNRQYFTLQDLLYIASREIGTGRVGGKSVGFLLARQILKANASEPVRSRMESHDSYYIGSDVFYTYIVLNGCWGLRMEQKTPEGYYSHAEELKEALLGGKFPDSIREQFSQMLEYFGQSPIIVRSSSLQEDGYGNAFAGKYESVFCANQGTPEERFGEFERAVRTVYASIMNEDALRYRSDRGLIDKDEQMAVLVQRVSGDHYGELFFPHVAGVANSMNLYLWDPSMDPHAGMLRLVFGLGTRAVDRVSGDYARIVSLDRPTDAPPVTHGEEARYSQHYADVLDLVQNRLATQRLGEVAEEDLRTDKELFFSLDRELMARMRDRGQRLAAKPYLADFAGLLSHTEFPADMAHILSELQRAYSYPVDVEFTANFLEDGRYSINILQCRPLQTQDVQAASEAPDAQSDQVLLRVGRHFIGGNLQTALNYVIHIQPESYLAATEQDKYQIARAIGICNQRLKDDSVMLIGPGRWGTTTPSLGVPVHFSDIGKMTALVEVAYEEMTPEISFGSHFFQDLVESGVFYIAVYGNGEGDDEGGGEGDFFHQEALGDSLLVDLEDFGLEFNDAVKGAIKVYRTPNLHLYSNIVDQYALCYFEEE